MDSPLSFQQRRVINRLAPTGPLPQGVVTGFGHAEHARHNRDRDAGMVRAHELVDPDGTAPVSLANQVAA